MLFARGAAAADRVEAIRLDFRAQAADCPDGATFLRDVDAQDTRLRLAEVGEASRTFRVHITTDDEGRVHGEFSVQLAATADASARRSISGATCSEVFEALVVFASLSLAAEAEALPTAPPITPSTKPADPKPVRPRKARAPKRGLPGDPVLPRAEPSVEAPPLPPARWFGAAGVQLGAMNAGLASPLPMIALFVRLGLGRDRKGGAFEPMARVSVSSVGGDTARTAYGSASLHWTALRVDPCPLDLRPVAVVSFRPCLTATAGLFWADGENVGYAISRRMFWTTLGGLVRLDWRLGQRFSLEADASLDAPIRRDRFHFEPAIPVYRVPATLASARLGLGFYFL